MAIVKNGALVADDFVDVSAAAELPAAGALIVSLEQWQTHRASLVARGGKIGLRLRSDQPPQLVAADLAHFAVIALEFPKFRDGRAYTHARMLRERLGYQGEVRAVGDVLQEQLHFMQRCGFNAFEIVGPDPVAAWRAVEQDHSVWYQATGDGRTRAIEIRTKRA
jgi:uncharacterized protein (DUF934 family)